MIMVLGDSILDEYVYCSSTRMSPECSTAPVLTTPNTTEFNLGGAANTAANIRALGGPATLLTSVAHGDYLHRMLNAWPSGEVINIRTHSEDTVKTRIYMNGEYFCRIDKDTKVETYQTRFLEEVRKNKPKYLVLSDYGKGTVPDSELLMILTKELDIKVIVDSKKNIGKYPGSYLVKPNLKEFWEYLGWSGTPTVDRLSRDIVHEARERLNTENLVITTGSQGCIRVTEFHVEEHKAMPLKCIDPTGAGDSFLAGLVVSLYEHDDLHKACNFANKVASVAVTKRGTQIVNRNEV